MAANDSVVVKTVENTNSPEDARKIDVNWRWRRAYFFAILILSSLLLYWVVEPRLNRLTDAAIILLIRYCFYTIWFGMGLYGAQSTVAEMAQAASIFFSGKRVTETLAPKNAVVETTPTAGGMASKVAAGEPAATVAAASDPPTPAPMPTMPKGVNEEAAPWARS